MEVEDEVVTKGKVSDRMIRKRWNVDRQSELEGILQNTNERIEALIEEACVSAESENRVYTLSQIRRKVESRVRDWHSEKLQDLPLAPELQRTFEVAEQIVRQAGKIVKSLQVVGSQHAESKAFLQRLLVSLWPKRENVCEREFCRALDVGEHSLRSYRDYKDRFDDSFFGPLADGDGSDASDEADSSDDERVEDDSKLHGSSWSGGKCLVPALPSRKTRSDYMNMQPIRDFLHGTATLCNDLPAKVTGFDADGNVVKCHARVQDEPLAALYERFHAEKQEEFQRFCTLNSIESAETYALSLQQFRRGACRCTSAPKMGICADELYTQLDEFLKALRKVRTYKKHGDNEALWLSCKCEVCADRHDPHFNLWRNAHRSRRDFFAFLLCAKSHYPALRRNHSYASKNAEEEAKVLGFAEKKAKKECGSLREGEVMSIRKTYGGRLHIPVAVDAYFHERECCTGKCGDCGPRLFDDRRCEFETSNDLLKWRKYIFDHENLQGYTNKRLVEVETTRAAFFEYFLSKLPAILEHSWDHKWDDFHRKRLFEGLPKGTLLIQTDFSAGYKCVGQGNLTCEHPGEALQQVFIRSHVGEDGKLHSKAISVWASKTDDVLTAGVEFHNAANCRIIDDAKSIDKLEFDSIFILSDQCGGQFKNKYNALYTVKTVEDRPWLNQITHVFAPTSCFKGACDVAGSDTKQFARKQERTGKARLPEAIDVFIEASLEMPSPRGGDALMTIEARDHYYMINGDHKYKFGDGTLTGKEYVEQKLAAKTSSSGKKPVVLSDKIIFVASKPRLSASEVEGIKKKYAMRARRVGEEIVFSLKDKSCWCNDCLLGKSDDCSSLPSLAHGFQPTLRSWTFH